MQNLLIFIINGIVLGAALAMDAFSVSIVNGLNESEMSRKKTLIIPFTFAFFQFLMPIAGWFFVTRMVEVFQGFRKYIPVIALVLLLYIGGKMLIESILKLKKNDGDEDEIILDPLSLVIQGIATSIDALSVGFTISEQNFTEAFFTSLIIAGVTFCFCFTGVVFGKNIGSRLSHSAGIIGGIVLIAIGINIFIA